MKTPEGVLEIFLQPGEFYFGDEKTRIRTLLGSCVAITMWHPKLNIGGMCHYMLPQNRRKETAHVLDGRYAVDAMQMFLREIHRSRARQTFMPNCSAADACSLTAARPIARSAFQSRMSNSAAT